MNLYLFDMDNTLTQSGEVVGHEIMTSLRMLREKGHELGIVGGGAHKKIREQLGDCYEMFCHLFSECGCVYHRNGIFQESKNLRNNHPRARMLIDVLIKKALEILAVAPYSLGGHMVDIRTGIVYISCVGMTATNAERRYFLEHHISYRDHLLNQLRARLSEIDCKDEIEIRKGGSVGIALFPKGWDKSQVINMLLLDRYQEIWYFGDSTGPDGNDESLLNHPSITHPVVVMNPTDTLSKLLTILSEKKALAVAS